MMPLTVADINNEYTIKKIGGSAEVKAHCFRDPERAEAL